MSNIVRASLLILGCLAIAIYWSGTYVVLFPTAHAPKGGWTTKDLGGCTASAARYRFGSNIVISDGKTGAVIGSDARYSGTPKGDLHIVFKQKDPESARLVRIGLVLDQSPERLTPKGVSLNKGPYKTIGSSKNPEEIKIWNGILNAYTFRKCPD